MEVKRRCWNCSSCSKMYYTGRFRCAYRKLYLPRNILPLHVCPLHTLCSKKSLAKRAKAEWNTYMTIQELRTLSPKPAYLARRVDPGTILARQKEIAKSFLPTHV